MRSLKKTLKFSGTGSFLKAPYWKAERNVLHILSSLSYNKIPVWISCKVKSNHSLEGKNVYEGSAN